MISIIKVKWRFIFGGQCSPTVTRHSIPDYMVIGSQWQNRLKSNDSMFLMNQHTFQFNFIAASKQTIILRAVAYNFNKQFIYIVERVCHLFWMKMCWILLRIAHTRFKTVVWLICANMLVLHELHSIPFWR